MNVKKLAKTMTKILKRHPSYKSHEVVDDIFYWFVGDMETKFTRAEMDYLAELAWRGGTFGLGMSEVGEVAIQWHRDRDLKNFPRAPWNTFSYLRPLPKSLEAEAKRFWLGPS